MSTKTAFILGGGGGKIGFAAGVVRALQHRGVTPSIISGVSSGNLVGIMAATGQYEQLEQLMHTLTDGQVIRKRGFKYFWRTGLHKLGLRKPLLGLYDNTPLRELLEQQLLHKTTVCDFYTGVVDIETDTFHHVFFPKGTVLDRSHLEFIRASTAIPFVFEPVKIQSKRLAGTFVDGGVHHNVPLEPASEVLRRRDDIDQVIVVSMNVDKDVNISVNDDIDMIPVLVNGILSRSTQQDIDHFKFINRVTKKFGDFSLNGTMYRHYPGRVFHPMRGLSDPLRFHHKFMAVDFIHGYKMAETGPV